MAVDILNAILGNAWAMETDALASMVQIASREGPGPEAVALQLGKKLENSRRVSVRDGVAIIPVVGPIFRRANLFSEISGATSIDLLARDLQEAVASDAIQSILLDIDSPGGQATGVGELAGHIAAMKQRKPIHAYVGGLGASGAYWLAAPCDTITLAPTAMVGSIGVVAAYRKGDDSREVEFVSSQSPKKRLDLETEDGRAEVQRLIDEVAEVFVSDVAKYRGVSREKVLSDFGRGGLLVGKSAVRVGMADRTGTLEGCLRGQVRGARMRGARTDTDFADEPSASESVESPAGSTFEAELNTLLAGVDRSIDRARAIHARRQDDGRTLSAARREQLTRLHEGLTALLRETEPAAHADVQRLIADTLRHRTGLEQLLV